MTLSEIIKRLEDPTPLTEADLVKMGKLSVFGSFPGEKEGWNGFRAHLDIKWGDSSATIIGPDYKPKTTADAIAALDPIVRETFK